MRSPDQVFEDFYRREGGWGVVTDRAADRGGLTHSGITMSSFNRWRAKHGERPLTRDEFLTSTRAQHDAFLEDAFVRPFQFIGDEAIQALVVDWAMNAGPDDPTVALQEALKRRGLYPGRVDGVAGPQTRLAWASLQRDLQACAAVESELFKARIAFHCRRGFDAQVQAFLQAHPTTQLHNLRGWINRTLEFTPEP